MNRKQPVMIGADENGEIIWDTIPMDFWQIKQLFYKRYEGNFEEQWMFLSAAQKGADCIGGCICHEGL